MAKMNSFPGMPGNMGQIMKQAQKMQEEMKKKQDEIESQQFEVSSAGGAIKVVMSGKKQLLDLSIDKDIVDTDDMEMLQDSIIAAVNEVLRTVLEKEESVYGKVTGNLNLPF